MSKEIFDIVDDILAEKGKTPSSVIPVLQSVQDKFNYLPEAALNRISEKSDISLSQIYGISTFYSQFRHKPVGQHIIKVCVGTACHVKGAMYVFDALTRELDLKDGDDTDDKGLFTLDKVACLGCCTIAPVVQIDDVTYGHVTTEKVPEILNDFLKGDRDSGIVKYNKDQIKSKKQGEIRIGLGSCCIASGSEEVKQEMESVLSRQKIKVDVKQVGCVGICNQVPLMEIHKPGEIPAYYTKIQPDEVKKIIKKHFKPSGLIDRVRHNVFNLFENIVLENTPTHIKRYAADKRDTPISEFLDGQINISTEHRGQLKPSDLEEYKRLAGFDALRKCLIEEKPEDLIATIIDSELRGRGGAGFPTGKKWEFVSRAKAEKKYIICNGDEGDPGAFMDRMLLESYPFRIIEGILIAAYATGAQEGLFYIRAEYPLAVSRIREALKICRNEGLIGSNILNSSFSFNLEIFEGAGAFVCGEETALIASVEGKRGMPSMRPPYPAYKGLNGFPTLINNTETFSMIPWIVRHGPAEFNKTGSENSKGTKVFALAGKINRGGLIEVPMGITIRDIVENIGGGIANNRTFKAVQIGGPSGGCIPASMANTPVDYESLSEIGAMMGSGGLIVLDETDCMVDMARYFLAFTQDQSCGKCTFCRIGTKKMLDILNKICRGKGQESDLAKLEDLAGATKMGSICGLGKSAPNPVFTTLEYFREEYHEHIHGVCPTGKCKEMIRYEIIDNCNGCTICAQKCPTEAIIAKPYEKHNIDQEKCIKCDICKQVCPIDAVITI